jgi:hypothetical protein
LKQVVTATNPECQKRASRVSRHHHTIQIERICPGDLAQKVYASRNIDERCGPLIMLVANSTILDTPGSNPDLGQGLTQQSHMLEGILSQETTAVNEDDHRMIETLAREAQIPKVLRIIAVSNSYVRIRNR